MTKTLNLDFCTCKFSHDSKRKLLCIEMFKKGKMFYKTQISKATSKFVKKYLYYFDNNEAKAIFELEIETL